MPKTYRESLADLGGQNSIHSPFVGSIGKGSSGALSVSSRKGVKELDIPLRNAGTLKANGMKVCRDALELNKGHDKPFFDSSFYVSAPTLLSTDNSFVKSHVNNTLDLHVL